MTKNETRLCDLFDGLVPMSGKADSLAGELVRAASRIGYRFFNDGDQLGIGYGRETCNPAGRFIIANTPREVGDTVAILWGQADEDFYETHLDAMIGAIVDYIEANPQLRNEPTQDMWSYRNEYEDVDEDDEDEEWF